jgi:hypothetical protein
LIPKNIRCPCHNQPILKKGLTKRYGKMEIKIWSEMISSITPPRNISSIYKFYQTIRTIWDFVKRMFLICQTNLVYLINET